MSKKIIIPVAKEYKYDLGPFSIEIDDNSHMLDEMVEQMTASINNIKTVIEQQSALIRIIEKDEDDAILFEQFLIDAKDSLEKMNGQKAELSKRANLMKYVAECKASAIDNKIDVKTIAVLLEALGVFSKHD